MKQLQSMVMFGFVLGVISLIGCSNKPTLEEAKSMIENGLKGKPVSLVSLTKITAGTRKSATTLRKSYMMECAAELVFNEDTKIAWPLTNYIAEGNPIFPASFGSAIYLAISDGNSGEGKMLKKGEKFNLKFTLEFPEK